LYQAQVIDEKETRFRGYLSDHRFLAPLRRFQNTLALQFRET
jgi:hypothetical protein